MLLINNDLNPLTLGSIAVVQLSEYVIFLLWRHRGQPSYQLTYFKVYHVAQRMMEIQQPTSLIATTAPADHAWKPMNFALDHLLKQNGHVHANQMIWTPGPPSKIILNATKSRSCSFCVSPSSIENQRSAN